MRKIWNTLIHGDRRTKLILWAIVLLILLSLASGVAFVFTLSVRWIGGVLVGLIVAAVLASSVNFNEIDGARQSGTGKEEKSVPKPRAAAKEENEAYLQQLQKRELKTLMFKYKVKRVHYPILIESCESRGLRQCPAYVWVNKGRLHFLALAANTSAFDLSLYKLQEMTAERAVRAIPKEEYVPIKEAKLIAKAFLPQLPSYYVVTEESGRRTNRKNSYRFGEDIVVTNRSASVLRRLTRAKFVLPEDEKMTRAYGSYATEGYKLKFLCQDEVISTEEYKDEIRALLQQMVEAEISDYEFSKNLSLMVKKQMITEEYAKFYQDAKNER